MNLKELEQVNDFLGDDSKFIGEYMMPDYKVLRGYIPGFGEDLRLYYTKFDPSIKKASLCIIHGFGEHQGRFLHVADYFAKLNFVVHMIDLRGFGFSGGPRGSQTLDQLQLDVEVLIRQSSKDLPLFLYGHAMGALLILSLLVNNPKLKVAGVITTAPILGFPKNRRMGPFKEFLIKNFGHYLEDLVINTNINPTSLTKNNYHIQRIFDDKLVMPFLGVGMARSIYQTLSFIFKNAFQFKYPLLIFHGKQDSQSDYQDSVKFIQVVGSQDKTLKLFEDGYHELQHDDEFEQIKIIIKDWVQQKIQISCPFGIIQQPRLKVGIPIVKNHIKYIIGLIIITLCYILLIIIRRQNYKKRQYPFIPVLILYKKIMNQFK